MYSESGGEKEKRSSLHGEYFETERMIHTSSTERMKRFILAGAVFLTSLFFMVHSFDLEKDAGLFPRYLSGFLIFLDALYLVDVLRGKDVPKKKREEIVKGRLLGAAAVSVAYVAALNFLGFLITSMICIPVFMVILGVRSKRTIALMSIISVAVLWAFFSMFLKVPLPEGILQI